MTVLKILTYALVILGQLRMEARQAKNAPLGAECNFGGEHKNVLTNCEAKNGFSAFRAKLEKHFKI